METFNVFFNIIANEIGSALMTILGQGILFAILGLVGGILLVNHLRKRKLFNRAFGFWTFVAKLNYVYLPFLLMVFGGSVGVLNGVHSAAENVIDVANKELVSYGQAYIADFQEYLKESDVEIAGVSVKEAVDAHLAAKANLGWMSGMVASGINLMLVRQSMGKMGVPLSEIDNVDLVTELSGKDLSTVVMSIPAMALKTQCSIVFWGFFTGLCVIFLPFFMLPVYEFGIHFLVSLFRGKTTSATAELAY